MQSTKLFCLFLIASLSTVALARTVWDGVYTKDQAKRGQSVYAESCTKCHGENLGGGEAGPTLASADFRSKWDGKSAGDLFTLMRKTMPSDDPGNLSTREYAALLAYILSGNDYPAGQTELVNDAAALNDIRIQTKR